MDVDQAVAVVASMVACEAIISVADSNPGRYPEIGPDDWEDVIASIRSQALPDLALCAEAYALLSNRVEAK